MEEIWKEIPGYEGYYEVSNLGNVRSLTRYVKHSRADYRISKGKVLKKVLNTSGYYNVHLKKENNNWTVAVHKLVAMAFLGHTPCGYKRIIDHIDNNKLNNNVNNLQITSSRHNNSKDKKNTSSKYTGVTWCKYANRWKSQIKIKGKSYHLGNFKCEIEASEAYKKALRNYEITGRITVS